jgi:hypothetical protein
LRIFHAESKRRVAWVALASVLALSSVPLAMPPTSQGATEISAMDETGIRATMAAYNAALNVGKTADVLPLYTEDGVFMPPYSQSAVGIAAVKAAYDLVFNELKFNVKFTIVELCKWRPNWPLFGQIPPGRPSIIRRVRPRRRRTRSFSS